MSQSTLTHRKKIVRMAALALSLMIAACHDSSSKPAPSSFLPSPAGTVMTTWGEAVAGAVVYLVPVGAVPTTAITSADVLSGAAESYDEPLEDAIAGPDASTFPQATTASDGSFSLAGIDTSGAYYPFVAVTNAMVGGQPASLYPGGTLSRRVRSGSALESMQIEITGHPSAAAVYIGSTTCLGCHPSYESQKVHAHRLGFREPGTTAPLQSLSRKPDFDDGLASFKFATSANFKTTGTSLFYFGYDAGRSFDKFQIADADPGGAEIRVYLWRDASSNEYRVTMENLATPSDPDRTYVVDLTYGGALYKQRFMLAVPDPGYKGRYPFLQFQHAGDDSFYDRTRKVWRDYHMDFFWDATAKVFKFPDKTKNIEANCMACHVTGYRYFDDVTTTEKLCDGVNDRNGVFDIDGDGKRDEINTGCEVCHGPGSEHGLAANPRFIVRPDALSPSRESQICGRCHDRVAGNDSLTNDQPLNAAGEMAPPGTSRADFLADYTSRKGPKLSSFWDDGLHSKSHHQQYPDFIKSKHYRNDRRLVTCSDCHDLHGKGSFDGNFPANPADGSLCAECHVVDLLAHLTEKTRSTKFGLSTSCTSCHYYKTAKTGAGRQGLLLGMPTGGASDVNITYWENDISSHLTTVPDKDNLGITRKVPGTAMPVPFVNECGLCHKPDRIKR